MTSEDQHERRAKVKKIYGDLKSEEDEDMEEIHAHFLILSSLASNDGGSKMIFGGEKGGFV